MNDRVLITGANGFVGRYVCLKLKEEGIGFVGIVQPGTVVCGRDENYIECDLLDLEKLEDIVEKYRPNAVLHLAAIANPTYGNVSEIYNINVVGTENLLKALCNNRNIKTRVILVSTAGVYGNQNVDYLDENRHYNPANHYAFSKMVMEHLGWQYSDSLDICVVRPFNMIGSGQAEVFLIPKLVRAFVTKNKVLKVGNIDTVRDYVDVQFASNVFYKLLTANSLKYGTYNLCSGRDTKGTEILQLLSEITNYMPRIEVSQEFVRKNEVWRMVGDKTRLNDLMGRNIMPKPLYNILCEMVEYYETKSLY